MQFKYFMFISICCITALRATGQSYAHIKLTPIATHQQGEVLFQTYRDINGMGAYNPKGIKIGWLVVSAKGIWDERVAFDVEKLEKTMTTETIWYNIKMYKQHEINLQHPDKVLKQLMKKYSFDINTPLNSEKLNILELQKTKSCYMEKCMYRILKQRSVENIVSNGIFKAIKGKDYNYKGEVIKKPFIYKGVALLHNNSSYEEFNFGATFTNLPPHYFEGKEIGYDMIQIDGIVIFNKEKFGI